MSTRKLWFPMVVAAVLTAVPPVLAEEKAEGEAPAAAAAPEASAADIAALIAGLDSDRFAERQAASRKLTEIGKAATAALAEAAVGDSLEVTVRSIDALKTLLDSSDEPTKDAAKAALEKIAKSDRPSAARRAKDALEQIAQQANPVPGGILGNAIQVQIAAAAGGRRVSIKTVNGVKEISAQEGDRSVKIIDDPKQGIKMEITTKKNGKQTTEKVEAKNAEELKKKNPEAYKLYDEYANKQGGMVVQMQVGGGGGPIRVAPRQIPKPRRPDPVDSAERILRAYRSHLDRMVTDEAIGQASPESRKKLKETAAEMRKELEKLETRLDKAQEKAGDEGGSSEEK